MNGDFAQLIDDAARAAGLNDYQLSAAIGLLSGNRVYSPKQVSRLRRGQVRHPDREVVQRLIELLPIPEDQAWYAAGIWPPDLDLESYRRFRHLAVVGASGDQPEPRSGRLWRPAGERRWADRRQRDRHLRLIPAA